MKKPVKISLVLLFVVVVAGCLWGPIVSNVEKPKYTVVSKSDAIEIRDYPSMIVAEAMAKGAREKAINEGFRTVADYIFGGNVAEKSIAMTAPVLQQPAKSTAENEGQEWLVRFVMPSEYTFENLPLPKDEKVRLEILPAQRFAVIRFSGIASEKRIAEKEALLKNYMHDNKLAEKSAPAYAFYNPPWTLPFLRRNEIMISVGE